MTAMKKKLSITIINISVAAFFVVCVLLPIISMFARITPEGFSEVINNPLFPTAIVNSLTTSLTSTVISVLFALAAAFCIERVFTRGREFFSTLFVLPMLIPSISHAFGLRSLLGNNGIITNLLGIDISIYGFWGIVAGSVMYSFPVAFLMFVSILKYEDANPYKAANVLGIPPYARFFGITLPYLKKTLISAFFAVFTMIITDYGVPYAIGTAETKTLSTLMFDKVSNLDNTASVIGAFLLIPALVAFLVDLFNPENSQGSYVTESVLPTESKTIKTFAYVFCTLMAVIIALPIFSFCLEAFATKYPVNLTPTLKHVISTFKGGADTRLLNSLLQSTLAALFGTIVAFTCSYLTTRVKGFWGKILHLMSITSMAIPGLVLGLSYLIFFKGSIIYGTLIIMVLVNSIHFFSSPYLMMRNTLAKVNSNLEDVGLILGIKRIRIIFDVILPKVWYTLGEMFVYFFVNSMMTISAVSFLFSTDTRPLSLMITQYRDLNLERAAFVSLLILIINVLLKALMAFIRKKVKH